MQSVNQASADERRRPSHRPLREELAHLYANAYGKTCRHDTLTALEAIVSWLRRAEREEGRTIVRPMTHAFRAIGWPTTGNAKADRSRHRFNLARRLDMLQRMGIVDEWRPVYAESRLPLGILVRLRRDSSERGARYARRLSHRKRPLAAFAAPRRVTPLPSAR